MIWLHLGSFDSIHTFFVSIVTTWRKDQNKQTKVLYVLLSLFSLLLLLLLGAFRVALMFYYTINNEKKWTQIRREIRTNSGEQTKMRYSVWLASCRVAQEFSKWNMNSAPQINNKKNYQNITSKRLNPILFSEYTTFFSSIWSITWNV